MAEATQYVLSHKEVAALIVKDQKLHEGLWSLQLNFGFGAMNMGPGPQDINPTAVVPILSIGIVKVTEVTSLTVDAAEVNPSA